MSLREVVDMIQSLLEKLKEESLAEADHKSWSPPAPKNRIRGPRSYGVTRLASQVEIVFSRASCPCAIPYRNRSVAKFSTVLQPFHTGSLTPYRHRSVPLPNSVPQTFRTVNRIP